MKLISHATYRRKPIYETELHGRFQLPKNLLDETLAHLRTFGKCEGLAFWGGTNDGAGLTRFTTLLKPQVSSQPLGVFVEAAEFGRMARTAIRSGVCLLAQIHSHPSDCTIHSDGDDGLVVTIFNGMLSLVVPNYAAGVDSLAGVTVHQWQNDQWIVASKASLTTKFEIFEVSHE